MSAMTLPSPAAAGELVPDEFLEQCLALYKPESIHVREAWYENRALSATFKLYSLDFHRRPLDHLSRVQIVHYVGQAAFVLGGCMAKEGSLAPVTEREYLRLIESGACTFNNLHLRFRRYLPNTDGTTIRISYERVRRLRNVLLSEFEFELNDGACYGNAHAIIPSGGKP
jgi:hypothetical protein